MEPRSAKEAVSNRWRQMEYKSGSPQAIPAGETAKEAEVIDLTSDTSAQQEEEEEETDIEFHEPVEEQDKPLKSAPGPETPSTRQKNQNTWCFKLMKSAVYDGINALFPEPIYSQHFITLEDILYDPHIQSTMLFSFQYNFDFIFSKIHPHIKHITLVAQTGTIVPLTIKKYIPIVRRTKIIEFSMPPYSCHHSKMIINFYKDKSCRIFLPSTNFTHDEANFPQQVCWCSPILSPREEMLTDSKNKFQESLLTYLQSYYPRDVRNGPIIPELKKLDFSSLKDDEISFIYSTTNKKFTSGLKLLNQILQDKQLLPAEGTTEEENNLTKHFLCQTSSMGNTLVKSKPVNILTHLMIPTWCNMLKIGENDKTIKYFDTDKLVSLYRYHKIKPYIVYPTVNELQHVLGGEIAQGWFNFYYDKNLPYYTMLRDKFKIFYKQDLQRVSFRKGPLPSHSKFYLHWTSTSDTTDFKELDWCCYTSSNLSLNAWGRITSIPRNYEVGVLIHKNLHTGVKLKCFSFTDLIYSNSKVKNETIENTDESVIVPFTLPVVPYSSTPTRDESYNRAIHTLESA